MPGHDHCCVPMCTNRRGKIPALSFHVFPRTEPLRTAWLVAIKRDQGPHFKVTKNTVVCSNHFTKDDFRVQDATSSVRRRLRPGAVPSLFPFSSKKPLKRPSPNERRLDAEGRIAAMCRPTFGPMTAMESYKEELKRAKETIAAQAAQIARLEAEKAMLGRQVFRFRNIRNDPVQLEYLTGISVEKWDLLWDFLGATPENILSAKSAATEADGRMNCPGAGRKSTLELEDELLITLMRLRLGWFEQALGYVFGISEASVSRILGKWINFLYLRLGLLPIWPEWEEVERTMPSVFKEAYPSTFAIIDATELLCEVPSSLSSQSQHYSKYKSHTTFKGLVAIAPNGAFSFISGLYTGSISDRELFMQSGIDNLLKKVPRGKSLMADRGFEVQDLILKHGLLLNIPPFKGSLPSLSKEDVKKTQRIARLRIHVERAIGQVKARFHIFDKAVPLSLSGMIDQMWTVCCMLTNFMGPLIGES